MRRFSPALKALIGTAVFAGYLLAVGSSTRSILLSLVLMPAILWILARSRELGRPIPRWLPLTLGLVGLPLFTAALLRSTPLTPVAALPWIVPFGVSVACLWAGLSRRATAAGL